MVVIGFVVHFALNACRNTCKLVSENTIFPLKAKRKITCSMYFFRCTINRLVQELCLIILRKRSILFIGLGVLHIFFHRIMFTILSSKKHSKCFEMELRECDNNLSDRYNT